MQLILAQTDEDYLAAAQLFKEYAAWLNIDLGFQHFDEELVNLKAMYNADEGGILLCKTGADYIACVAVRKNEPGVAELKRMYVQPQYQRKGIGELLLDKALALARQCNYSSIRLDTLNNMLPAINLYKKYGFIETAPYYYNPQSTAVYFEKKLSDQ